MSQIADNIQSVRQELPENVTLVAVSKFKPAEDIMEAYRAGQRIFGENRPQELKWKAESLPKDIQWHLIGHLQKNKIKMAVPYAALIHSVDTADLLMEIEKYCAREERTADVLIEIHIASEESKHGFTREEVLELLPRLELHHVRIRGVMGMASFTGDETLIRSEFALLNSVYEEVSRMDLPFLSDFGIRSFGMTNDYRIAVEMGSNMVRIGTKIFGPRDTRL
ncbi:MAG TPA: YggS family pyridoxal phosphate-dependent enzyme [Candidatus Coprenecus stercoripullorum]|nr:YggS family pyridoxal phosphate-dependent enzyme [Candidatus Coprenecus stercoripullorum]